jgi:alkylation response protein AidB-like acyl-CoA dehydrogenase
MDFAFNEEQEELRRLARRWLEEGRGTSAVVRQLMETESGHDPSHWKEMCEMGWVGIAIPEEYGGAGYTFLELTVLLEEMGRSLFPSPFFATVVMGAGILLEAASDEQKQRLLPQVVAGHETLALAYTGPDGDWARAGGGVTAGEEGGRWVLDGTASFVVDGHTASTLLVAASTPAGPTLFLVPGEGAGVGRRRLETMDMTRKLAEVTFDQVVVEAGNVVGAPGAGERLVARAVERAVVGLAAEQVGGAQKCLDMAVEYAKVRHQFGRPIGSFQAIKHKCADMLVQVESARSAAYYAAWAAAEDNDELPLVAPLAKSYCSEAYFFCAAENIQIHGGIGFTWEHDAHLYFKRAKSSELLFGDPAYHREVLAGRLGL